jgi:putative sterol carrier protein
VDATTKFFEKLASFEGKPARQRGTTIVRFELRNDDKIDRWRVTLSVDGVGVMHRGGEADCIVRADRATFNRLASGQANVMAAMLRGVLVIEGDPASLIWLQRLFPGPPPTRSTSERTKART